MDTPSRVKQSVLDLSFGSRSAHTAIDTLADFQNTDGEFGKALEPDI